MTITVETAPPFEVDLKRLARKYPQVLDELDRLITVLESGEHPGDKIPQVGYDVYKVRVKNTSAGKGKRGGFRVLYFVRLADQIILLTIYSKSQQEDIDLNKLRRIIQNYLAAG